MRSILFIFTICIIVWSSSCKECPTCTELKKVDTVATNKLMAQFAASGFIYPVDCGLMSDAWEKLSDAQKDSAKNLTLDFTHFSTVMEGLKGIGYNITLIHGAYDAKTAPEYVRRYNLAYPANPITDADLIGRPTYILECTAEGITTCYAFARVCPPPANCDITVSK